MPMGTIRFHSVLYWPYKLCDFSFVRRSTLNSVGAR